MFHFVFGLVCIQQSDRWWSDRSHDQYGDYYGCQAQSKSRSITAVLKSCIFSMQFLKCACCTLCLYSCIGYQSITDFSANFIKSLTLWLLNAVMCSPVSADSLCLLLVRLSTESFWSHVFKTSSPQQLKKEVVRQTAGELQSYVLECSEGARLMCGTSSRQIVRC